MLKKTLSVLCFLMAAVVLLTSTMNAQLRATGTISGYVTDDRKDPLPGVTVTATSPTMPGLRQVVSDANGYYKFQALQPGKFKIVVELNQFNKQTYENLELNVGASLRLDVMLTPKTLTEKEIVVTAPAPLVETEKTTIDTVIDSKILNSLPILGRDFMSSIKILPGVVDTVYGVSIAGGRDTDKNYNIDGADNVDTVQGQAMERGGYAIVSNRSFISFDQEAIQELSVALGGYSADVGFGSAGLINVVTKSGSNQVHGSLYLQARSNRWDFDVPTPYENYYFGGSFSGPIIKDKLLFFLSISPSVSRNGYDTRSYLYADVPESLRDKSTGISNFLKLTYLLNRNNTLNVTANVPLENYKYYVTLYHIGTDFPWMKEKSTGFSLAATETAMLSADKVLESVLSYGKTNNKTVNQPGVHQGLVFYDDGLYASGTYGSDADFERTKINWSERFTAFVDNWHGKHTIKAGVELRHNSSYDQRGYVEDVYYYPSDYPDFYPAVNVSFTDAYALKLSQTYIAGYVTDTWSPFKKLTVNLGVRASRNSYLPRIARRTSPRIRFRSRRKWQDDHPGKFQPLLRTDELLRSAACKSSLDGWLRDL